jgi:hypothetical protein
LFLVYAATLKIVKRLTLQSEFSFSFPGREEEPALSAGRML